MHDSQLIVQAVVACATADPAGLETATAEACSDFLAALTSRVSESEDAQYALEALMKSPNSKGRQAFCREELDKLDLGADDQLIEAATELTGQFKHRVMVSGRLKGYTIRSPEATSVVIGDQALVESSIALGPAGDDREEQEEEEGEEGE